MLQEQRDDGSRRSWSYDPASPWSPLAALEQAGNSRSADIYWYHTDLNSAPLEVTDAAGNLCWSGQYDTFGKLQGQTVAGAAKRQGAQYQQPLRYAGQYQDDESGLHYNLFRYYEPEVGRFTTQDSIGLAGGMNTYAYVGDPMTWVDSLGLKCGEAKDSYEQARNKALKWLEDREFKAEKVKTGKFGSTKGKPVGMTTMDGKTGFRIEYNERSGAHINVFSGKDKGGHFLFDSPEFTVEKL